jgi:hypothetical protein
MKHQWIAIVVFAAFVWTSTAFAQEPNNTGGAATEATAPRLIKFSGSLKDAAGLPQEGQATMTFSLYASQEGGESLWDESQLVNVNEEGQYTIYLGASEKDGLPLNLFSTEKAQWLGVRAEGAQEQPRVALVAAPYALKAADADTVGGKPLSSFVLYEDLAKAVEKIRPFAVLGYPSSGKAFGNHSGATNSAFDSSFGTEKSVGPRVVGRALRPLGLELGNPSYNTYYGNGAGGSITTGYLNSFFGYGSGHANTTGGSNAFFGSQSGQANTTGVGNSFFGLNAGYSNIAGGLNSFAGFMSGYYNTTGGANSFFGAGAGFSNTTGNENSFFGYNAGSFNTTGRSNIFVGNNAGVSNTTENSNSYIGSFSDGAAGITNATAIGYQAKVTQNNSLILGSINGVNSATADTKVGIGITAPAARLDVAGAMRVYPRDESEGGLVLSNQIAPSVWQFATYNSGKLYIQEAGVGPRMVIAPTTGNVGIGTAYPQYTLHVAGNVYATGNYLGSDVRMKQNISNLKYGLGEVMQLRPVSYEWKDQIDGQSNLGLIAQEVEPIIPELIAKAKDENGMLSLNYVGLVPVLIKAIQQQQTSLEKKDAEIASLNARLTAIERKLAALTTENQEGK